MIDKNKIKIGFAGDRKIAVDVLRFIQSEGINPAALIVSSLEKASHAGDLKAMCSHLEPAMIAEGKEINDPGFIERLTSLDLDFIICIHFPEIIREGILSVPKEGVLNLHPAYLPYNKGWHTPSWAIIDETPFGATLHFMSPELDRGDIISRAKVEVDSTDTANSLYQKALAKELEVFINTWPSLVEKSYVRTPQTEEGTSHRSRDLKKIQEIDLDTPITPRELLKICRGLTTNNIEEAPYYIEDGEKYVIKLEITRAPHP